MKIGNSFLSFALIGLCALALAPQLKAQTVSANPTSISLSAPASSTNPATQGLTFTVNGGNGQVLVMSATPSWLKVVVATVQTCQSPVTNCSISNPPSSVSVTVRADPTGQPSGTLNGAINYGFSGGVSTQVLVTFTVGTGVGTSVLAANPGALTFSALPGASGGSQNVAISNQGSSINYTVSSSSTWLTTNLFNSQGVSPGQLTVSANASNLVANTYNGTLTLTPVGGGQSTTITVTFVVSNTQQFQINPSALTFGYISGSNTPITPQTFSVGVTTGAAVAYTVSVNYGLGPTNWIQTNPATSGTTGTLLSVTPIATSLGVGTYTATLTFAGGGLPQANVTVTLVVSSPPTFVVSPTAVTITVQPGSTASRSLSVNTSNGAVINYTATPSYLSPLNPSVGWLTLLGASGSTPGTVTVGVSPGNLAVGTYTAQIAVTSTTPGVAQFTVSVTMVVTNSQIVTFLPTSLSFSFVGGGVQPTTQFVQLGLTPASPIQTATVGAVPDVIGQTWLTATLSSPSGSQITGNAAANVSVNASGLANGTYTGKVQINVSTANGPVANSTVEVPVTFTVSGVTGGGGGGGGTGTTTLLFSQGQLVFNTTPGGVAPDQTIVLTSSTSTQIPYNLTTIAPWLTILNGSGTTPGQVTFRVNTSQLQAGPYSGQVNVSATGASNNGAFFNASLSISSQNQLQTNPSGFTFNYVAQSGLFPLAQTLQLTATTNSLPVTTQIGNPTGGAWLSVTPPSFNTPSNMQISINSAVLQTLAPGTYSANLTLQANGALNSSVSVPITLNVTGSTSGGGGTGLDQLVVGPTPLAFYSNVVNNTLFQTLDINSLLGSTLPYTLTFATTSGGSWLSVNQASGNSPAQVTVQASTSNLQAGVYNGGITVASSTATNSGITIPVTLTVSTATNLVASQSGVTFNYVAGGSGALLQRVITITTTNNVSVPISVSTNSATGLLTVSTNSNTTPASITISLNPSSFPLGTAFGTVFVNTTAGGVGNSPLSLPVTLIVTGTGGGTGTAQLAASPNSLTFVGQPGGASPQQRAVQVTSSGTAISYSVTSNSPWLSAGPSSGSTPGTITVSVNPASLTVGTYSGQVTISGGGSTVNLPVTFEVTNNPVLQLNQQSVTFNYQTGQALPPPRPILVTTSNGSSVVATVNVGTSSGGNWLQTSAISVQTPGAFALSLVSGIASTLSPGTYAGTVTVSASGVSGNNAVINVTLNVSSTGLLTMSTTPITFNAQFNGNQPPTQIRQITATSGSLNVSVSSSTTTGIGWLTASVNTNTTPATLTIAASPFGLGTGIYSGTVTVSSGGASVGTLVIPVTLNVSSLPLISVDKSELIYGSGGTSGTQPQTIQISSSSTNFNYTVNASVSNSPTNWLTVSSVNGVTPSSLVVNVNPALLGDGTYFGTIVISAPSTGNTPLVIPVTLTVNNATALQVTPISLSFTQVQGGAVSTTAQQLGVTSQQQVSFSYTAAVQSPVGGNWLNVQQSGGQTNGFLLASLNNSASSLPAGVYTATITVFGSNSPNQVQVPVTLTVVPSASLQVTPITLSFTGRVGQPNPQAQLVQLASSNAATQLAYNVSSDAVWLTGTPVTGTTPATLSVAVNLAALPAGVFSGTGRLTVTPSGSSGLASGQPVVITVNLQVDQVPSPNITGFANAATFQPGSLSPGMIISLVGTNLGPTSATNGQIVGGRFTTALVGVRVLFDGIPAPVLYASATQINAVVPYGLAGRASSRMSVEYNNIASNTIEPRLVDTAPGIFTADGRQAAMINENGTFNGPSNPAPTGSIVVIYVTGEGSTSPAGVDGEVIGSNLKRPLGAVRVRVGGIEVPATEIFYAGSAPTLVSGLMQINFRLPAATPTGISTSVEVFVGTGQSQPGVTMSVR